MVAQRRAAPAFVDINVVIELVAAQIRVSPSEVWPQRRFVEDLGAGEVEIANLLLALEERLEVQIQERDAKRLRTLSAVIHFLDDRLAGHSS